MPVIENGGTKAVGNISLRDIQFLLTAPEIYHDYRCVYEIYFHLFAELYIVVAAIVFFFKTILESQKELLTCTIKLNVDDLIEV